MKRKTALTKVGAVLVSGKVGTSEPLLYSVDAIDVFTLETLYSVENNAKIYVR